MMFKKTRLLAATFCTMALYAAGQLNAQLTLTPAEEMMIHSQQVERIPQEFAATAGIRSYDDDSAYLYRISAYAYYYPVAVTGSGEKIQLHDASLWYVHPYQRATVKRWVQSDPLFIKPNASCFSLYKYVLQNRNTNEVVEVNLIEPPIDTGAYTHWITNIDWYNRWVYLNDGTIWKINASDYAFNSWQIGQRLIIGVNNKWRVTEFPHVLINTGIYNAPYCEADFY